MLTSKRSALFNEHRYRNTGDVDLSKRDDCTTRQTCCETGTQSRESLNFLRDCLVAEGDPITTPACALDAAEANLRQTLRFPFLQAKFCSMHQPLRSHGT